MAIKTASSAKPQLDAYKATLGKIGSVVESANPEFPVNHLPADGKVYSKAAYPELSNSLGSLDLYDISSRLVSSTFYAGQSMTYSDTLNRLVAVGNGGYVSYSDDLGYTWTTFFAGGLNINWKAVTWCGDQNKFVAVGTNNSMYSVDGITWTINDTTPNVEFLCLTYSETSGLFLAGSATVSNVMKSADGIAWSAAVETTTSPQFFILAAPNGAVISLSAATGTTICHRSLDGGQTWSTFTTDKYQTGLAYSPSLNVWISPSITSPAVALYSNDNFETYHHLTVPSTAWRVVWMEGYGKFIMYITTAAYAMFSDDGVNWTSTFGFSTGISSSQYNQMTGLLWAAGKLHVLRNNMYYDQTQGYRYNPELEFLIPVIKPLTFNSRSFVRSRL